MEKIPTHLADIFSSEKRIKIYEVVSTFESPFTPRQIWRALDNDNASVPISMIFTCRKALLYRGYLTEAPDLNLKKERRGRPEIRYIRSPH